MVTLRGREDQFGQDVLDGARFDRWRAEHGRAGEGSCLQLPPLLVAARMAERWMTGGMVEFPKPLQTRTRVLNGDLDQLIRRRYPAFRRSAANDVAPSL